MELTLAALGVTALTEGIKFMYAQAGEVLKRWRERRDGRGSEEPVVPAASEVIEGRLEPATPKWDALERVHEDLEQLVSRLSPFYAGVAEVDPADEQTLRVADAVRRNLEVVLGQRITFKGEQREPSGPMIVVESDVDDVAGYSASVRAASMIEGRVEVTRRTGVVREGGQDVAVDIDRIGGS